MVSKWSLYIVSLTAFILCSLGTHAIATGVPEKECKKISCPPHVWVKQPSGVDIKLTAGEPTKLIVEARNFGRVNRFSFVVDCYYGGVE